MFRLALNILALVVAFLVFQNLRHLKGAIPRTLFYRPQTDIQFHLYTRHNNETSQVLRFKSLEDLRASHFDPQHPTKFLIHGWTRDINEALLQKGKAEFLNLDSHNVFAVDWSLGACHPLYHTARYRVEPTARVIAEFIAFLVENSGLRLRDVHVIGHSLGAHIAGTTGKFIQKLFPGKKIPRITGLDPAGFLFDEPDTPDTLSKNDAQHVEVVHSSSSVALLNTYLAPLGHIDFYPNGGRSQPGCGIDLMNICSHDRAVDYYVESINPEFTFKAHKCAFYESITASGCHFEDDFSNIGGSYGEGVYWFQTNSRAPFSQLEN